MVALSNLTGHARDLRMGIASAILPLGQLSLSVCCSGR
jgi:hypothetical protein